MWKLWKALLRFFSRKKKIPAKSQELEKEPGEEKRLVFVLNEKDLTSRELPKKRFVFNMDIEEVPGQLEVGNIKKTWRKRGKEVSKKKVNGDRVRKTCTYCQFRINDDEDFYTCTSCGAALHKECIDKKGLKACLLCKANI